MPTSEGHAPPWMLAAACRGQSPRFDREIYGERPSDRPRRLAWAMRRCERCPVLQQCRRYARETNPHGVVLAGRVWA